MEGLVLLLGELLAMLLVPTIGALVVGVTAAVELLAELAQLALEVVFRRRRDAERGAAVRRSPGRARRWMRRIGRGAAVVVAIVLLLVCVADLFLFTPIVRFTANRIAARTGIAIEFADADGSLWQGRARLLNAHVRRPDHPTGQFDLRAESIEIDLSVWRLLFLTPHVESVVANGMTGTYVRTGIPDRLRARRPFHCDRLQLADAAIAYRDLTRHRPIEARVAIDSLRAAPFRSDHAVFDILFRADVAGTLDGHAIAISSKAIEGGRQTHWHGDGLPLAVIAPYLPGPLAWIDQGTIDVDVRDRWDLDGPAEIAMDWKLDLHDIHVTTPADVSLKTKALALPVVKLLNRRDRPLPLHFTLNIDPRRFEGRASPEAAGLADAVADAIGRYLTDRFEIKSETLKSLGRKAASGVKSFIDRRRKRDG